MVMDEKYLLYESQAARDNVSDDSDSSDDSNVSNDSEEQKSLRKKRSMWLWNDRLLLIENEHDAKHWHFTAFDLITNETRPVHFLKSDNKFSRVKVITLNNNYGFVIESFQDVFCVNLVKLMWAPGEFQLIEQINQEHQFSGILMSNLNPTQFILAYENIEDENFAYIYQACTLDSGKIEFGDLYESSTFFEHCFNKKLFVFYDEDEDFEVKIYDWMTKKRDSVAINAIPDGQIDIWRVEWIKERLYATVYSNDTRMYGICYTDLEPLDWNFLDLSTDLRISRMQFFNGNLVIYAANNTRDDDIFDRGLVDVAFCSKFKIYSIPIQHPQSLRKMAWPLVVQQFKRDESIDDPYQEAARFLPFNSDLRPPWYKEEAMLEYVDESSSNKQSQDQDNVDSSKVTFGKASESTSNQESPDAVPSKRTKFN